MALWDNIQGRWSLNNGVWTDSSGNGNTLTASASAPTAATGHGSTANAAAGFVNANSQYLKITDAAQAGLDITGNLTVAGWFYATRTGVVEVFWGKSPSSGQYSYSSYKNTSNQLVFQLSSNGTALTTAQSTTPFSANTWYHVACVYDGIDMRIYINGTLDITPVAYTAGIFNSNGDLVVGANGLLNNYFWDGRIDDVCIFNRALSASEISELFNLPDDFFSTYSYTATGGGIAGGAATQTSSVTHISTGGGVCGGTAAQLKTSYFDASGGGVAGGNADYLFDGGGYYTAQGGAVAGGSADITTGVIFMPSGGGVGGGTSPYSFTITAVIMEILWRIVDPTDDTLVTGASANTAVKVRRTPDGYIYDWSDSTFKASGWVSIAPTMSEVDTTNLPGLYKKELNIAPLIDGWYQVYADYNGAFKDYADTEFLISSGNLVDIKTSVNLDAKITTRPTLSEIEGSAVLAKEATAQSILTESQTHPTLSEIEGSSILAKQTKLDFIEKWVLNRLTKTTNGTTETWVLYDDNNTTALKTWTWDSSTNVRTKAT